MSFETVQLLVICSLVVFIGATPLCPVNEEWNECDSACPPTCQNRSIQVCTDNCIARCSCIKGYIRQSPDGRCVPDSCTGIPVCKENEELSNCATLCPETCDNTTIRACPLVCLTGCVCRPGYVRSREGGECIPRLQCNVNCADNEEFALCGSECPGTCDEPVKKCDRKCAPGCVCKRGYTLLNERSRGCVRQEECPVPVA